MVSSSSSLTSFPEKGLGGGGGQCCIFRTRLGEHAGESLSNLNFEKRKVLFSWWWWDIDCIMHGCLSLSLLLDITHCASLMSTSMVAFLLLTKHREVSHSGKSTAGSEPASCTGMKTTLGMHGM